MQPDFKEVDRAVNVALAEDVGRGDITSRLVIPATARGAFAFVAREEAVICGLPVVMHLFSKVAPPARGGEAFQASLSANEGVKVKAGTKLLTIRGEVQNILAAERVALNFLQHLSGIATKANQFVEAVKGTKTVILDTRKTTPGLRELEKYAARVGGARNHRMRLDDGVLIKDNHIAICGSVTAAIETARKATPVMTRIEVECDTPEQAKEAMKAGADMLLLDNMKPETIAGIVKENQKYHIPLEASGGINLKNVRAYAEAGVDFISVGAITHSAPWVDIGLDEVKE
ncbi:MAG: carboxylating nicotinate-nucleotide diphosphorylase [Proteobacteria bacterium]|nr:carboxylating nicotinate-nucleotide diphosphorylase [Pseudomonadota bacterium]